MSHLPMKLLRKKIEKRNLKLRQRNLKLQAASDVSLSETQNGDVSEDTLGGGKVKKALKQSVKAGLSEAQNGALSKTMEGGKVKKSLKQSVKVGLSEAQNGDLSNETVEDENVKKSPKKSAILTNGGAATQPPNSESKKKKKKKKRKMADDAGPDTKKSKN